MAAESDSLKSLLRPILESRRAKRIAAPLGLALLLTTLLLAYRAFSLVLAIPVVLSGYTRRTRAVWITAVCMALIALLAANSLDRNPDSLLGLEPDMLGWIAALRLVLVAALVHLWLRRDRLATAWRAQIERQASELELLGGRLLSREAEIAHRNEAFEARTIELRTINQHLAARERLLEHLLELSRSLSPELERDDVLAKLCNTGALVLGGSACVILERLGAEIHVLCHSGLGGGETVSRRLNYAHSFASLVMSTGHTTYIHDLAERPDLEAVQPADGPRYRSALGSPVRVKGVSVGTIEIYGLEPREWTTLEFSILESLAGQVSASLKNAELNEVLQKERRRFEAAFNTAPIGLAVADDPSGRTIRLNPMGCTLLGVAIGENVSPWSPAGARLVRHMQQDGSDLHVPELPIVRALQGEVVEGVIAELSLPTRRLTLFTSSAPLYDNDGHITGAVAAFVDVTEMKRLERELDARRREAENASIRKTRFLASLSHDIRTPVNAIGLLADLIQSTASDPALAPQLPRLTQRLRSSSDSLAHLVTAVLDFAQFESGISRLEESAFGLGELIEEERTALASLATEKGLRFVVDPLGAPIWLYSDRVKLARILSNLLSNAIKYTQSGEVRITASLDSKRQAIIQVSDTGVGIDPTEVPKIFDEFAQLRPTGPESQPGVGLGLSICARLIRLLGGTISVESEPGRGSAFSVILPANCTLVSFGSRPTAAKGSAIRLLDDEGTNVGGLDPLRILIAEDHEQSRLALAQLLTAEGAHVVAEEDGRAALQRISSEPFHAVILDLMLPGMEGEAILEHLRENRPPCLELILVVTGETAPDRLQRVRSLGADQIFPKPVDFSEIRELLTPISIRTRLEST